MHPKAAPLLAILALVVAACGAPDAEEPTGSARASPTSTASASGQPSGTPTAAPPTPTPAPPVAGGDLPVPGFALVTAEAIFIRQDPGTDGEPLVNADFCIDNPDPDCARPFMLGTDSGYVWLYVFDGPVEADGYAWYLAATEMNTEERASTYPEAVGWVASGDAEDEWLVADTTRTCPDRPVELAEITSLVMTRLERLDCFGSEPLTVRGWYPDLPPGETERSPSDLEACAAENGWPACGSIFDLLRPDQADWAGDAHYLDFVVDPTAGITMPARSQWLELTGSFDHPASSECVGVAGVLNCRANFVVTSVRVP